MRAIQRRTYEILFGTLENDRAASIFGIFILTLIAVNITVGIIETDQHLRVAINTFFGFADSIGGHSAHGTNHNSFFWWFEAVSVAIFSVEYLLRIWCAPVGADTRHPVWGRLKMMAHPMLIIDLLAIAPFYLAIAFGNAVDLRFVRALRLFRLFRIFRAGPLARSFRLLAGVVRDRKDELVIAFIVVAITVILSSSIMYLVEHEATDNVDNNAFQSVPDTMWWAIITVTTVGYGDVSPITTEGKILGSFIAFLGVCVFALPVGIIGAGFVDEIEKRRKAKEEAEEQAAESIGAAATDGWAGSVGHWMQVGREAIARFRVHGDEGTRERALAEGWDRLVEAGWALGSVRDTYVAWADDPAQSLADAATLFVEWADDEHGGTAERLIHSLPADSADDEEAGEPTERAAEHLRRSLASLIEMDDEYQAHLAARTTVVLAIGRAIQPEPGEEEA